MKLSEEAQYLLYEAALRAKTTLKVLEHFMDDESITGAIGELTIAIDTAKISALKEKEKAMVKNVDKENPRKAELIKLLSEEHEDSITNPEELCSATFHNFKKMENLQAIQGMQVELFNICKKDGTIKL